MVDYSYVLKSKGTSNPVTGSDKVCGDKLCSEDQKELMNSFSKCFEN